MASSPAAEQFEVLRAPLIRARTIIEDQFFSAHSEIDPDAVGQALDVLIKEIAVNEHQLNRSQKGRVFLIQLKGFVIEIERLLTEFEAGPDEVPYFDKLRSYLEHQFKTSTVFNEPGAQLPWERESSADVPSTTATTAITSTAAAAAATTTAPPSSSTSSSALGGGLGVQAPVEHGMEPKVKPPAVKTGFGLAIGVESFVLPTIGHISIKTYTNNNRQVTVSGTHFAEPVSAELNGHAYKEVTMTKEGVGLVFHVDRNEFKDLGLENKLIITCAGTPSRPYKGSFQYENRPQLWSLRVHEHKAVDPALGQPYNIKGLNFAPGKTGVTVSISDLPATDITKVDLLDDTTIDFWTRSELHGERNIRVTVANVQSDPFLKDFDAVHEESEFQKLVQRRAAEAAAEGNYSTTTTTTTTKPNDENDSKKSNSSKSLSKVSSTGSASGFSFGRVDSFVKPRVGHLSVKTYPNCNRQVTISGGHLEEPVVVKLNGVTYDKVEVTKQGVGVVFSISKDQFVDKGTSQNDLEVMCKGVSSDPMKVTFDYENKPVIWSCRADEVPADQPKPTSNVRHTIKGLNFAPGLKSDVQVRLGRLALHDAKIVDDTTITFVLDHMVYEGQYEVVVTVAGVVSDPMIKDFALSQIETTEGEAKATLGTTSAVAPVSS